MTSDMGGLYRIAEALKTLGLQANPQYLAFQTEQLQVERDRAAERLELDRRALAIQYAKDTVKIDFRTDKEPNPPPEYERVLETARAYYTFLLHGPSGVQDESNGGAS